MNWFERLTGFTEKSYLETQGKLVFDGALFYSTVNDKKYHLGTFEILSLGALRNRVLSGTGGREEGCAAHGGVISQMRTDAFDLHRNPIANGAVIQVASQFNLLEMPSPYVNPECGVTAYMHDATQGPACAMAAGPATLYRNYGVQFGEERGQSKSRQINALDDLLRGLAIEGLTVKNGYAMCSQTFLHDMKCKLESISPEERERVKGLLKVGVHWGTEVTAPCTPEGQRVTQVFCSALPIAYNANHNLVLWEPFARLILEAAYEATVCVGILNSRLTLNRNLFLTRVGGGVFGNPSKWIDDAVAKSLSSPHSSEIDIHMVHKH